MGAALSRCHPGLLEAATATAAPAVLALENLWGSAGSSGAALLLRVELAPIEESDGALVGGFKVDDQLVIRHIGAPDGLEALGLRFRDGVRSLWPRGHRFQNARRSWHVQVEGGPACVLQVAILPEERSLDNVRLDIADASDAIAYASRFNHHQRQRCEHDPMPSVKVAAPVACTVAESCYPAMIPKGTVCTLIPYPLQEVRKFVFEGLEEFMELPQAYFHYAAFSSNGKHFVCDVQGGEMDTGDLLLIDPCILKADPLKVEDIVRAAVPAATGRQALSGPSAARFDALHPRCAEVCHAFDPQRKSARRPAGPCGVGGACGFGR